MRSPAFALTAVLAVFLFGLSGTTLRGAEHRPAAQPGVPAEAPFRISPVDRDLNAALALLLRGEIDAAIDVVRPHLSKDSRAVELLFRAGTAALSTAQEMPAVDSEGREVLLDAATAIFRAVLAEHPDHVRARLELAHTFFLRGRDGLARRNFERALAANPPPAVVANVNRFLAQIRARKRWSGHFGMALAPDTNIGAASASETVLLDVFGQRLPFTLDDGGETSGVGVLVWAGGERQEPLAPNWRLRLGGDVFRREYSGSRFDRMGLGGHVGPRWLAGPRTEASMLFAARRDWQAGRPVSRSLGLRMEASRRLSPRLSGQLGASWTEKRHDESTHLDGPRTDLSAGLSWAATPTLQANVRAGWASERPEAEDLGSRTRWASLGASAALPRGFSLSGTLTARRTGYEGPGRPPTNVVDGVSPREDVTRSLRVSALKRDLTIRGFSPQLSVTHERRESNAQQADYRRTGAELSFVRQF